MCSVPRSVLGIFPESQLIRIGVSYTPYTSCLPTRYVDCDRGSSTTRDEGTFFPIPACRFSEAFEMIQQAR